MLVAQALHEGLTLVTRDDRIQKYDVPTPPGTCTPHRAGDLEVALQILVA
ncbi:hypothetical protein OG400_30500 [Micromonospora ureilytica]|nr:hypothetical protein OG400_30500 [Micromonospora ureilytica]